MLLRTPLRGNRQRFAAWARRVGLRTLVALSMLWFPGLAPGNEVWLLPHHEGGIQNIGTWPVTAGGAAFFSIAVPDDMEELLKVTVVIVPEDVEARPPRSRQGWTTRVGTYDLHFSIARDGERTDALKQSILGVPVAISPVLTEVDVSQPLRGLLAGDNAGRDYVGRSFVTPLTGVRVLGCRFVYRSRLGRYVETRSNPYSVGFDPRRLGFADELVSQFGFLHFPSFDIGGYTTLGTTQMLSRNARDSWSYQLNLNRMQGRHQIRAGAEFRIYNENQHQPGSASGAYSFDKGFTQANPARSDAASGDGFASFLLGYPSAGRVNVNIDPAYQSHYYALFVQDDWKIAPRFTVNVGLRWDYESPYRERYNRMLRGFAFREPSPIAEQVPELELTGGLLFAGSSGEQRFAFQPDRNNVQPRIGFAYRLADR